MSKEKICPRCDSSLVILITSEQNSRYQLSNKALWCKKCRDIILLNNNIGVLRA